MINQHLAVIMKSTQLKQSRLKLREADCSLHLYYLILIHLNNCMTTSNPNVRAALVRMTNISDQLPYVGMLEIDWLFFC